MEGAFTFAMGKVVTTIFCFGRLHGGGIYFAMAKVCIPLSFVQKRLNREGIYFAVAKVCLPSSFGLKRTIEGGIYFAMAKVMTIL